MKKLIDKIGVNPIVAYTLAARFTQAIGVLVTITFITLFLSKQEQGYFYTFSSIVFIQTFFELGLNGIIVQFVAHEMANLQWDNKYSISGNQFNLSRLSSIFHFSFKLFLILAFFLFIILEFVGYYFFSKYHQNAQIQWQLPWLILAFSTALMLPLNNVLAILEGLGKVKEVAKIRLLQYSVNTIVIALVFVCGGKLFASGIASFSAFLLIIFVVYFSKNRSLLKQIYASKTNHLVSYRKEIFPYQFRIALSWISGYFMVQLFNPVLFAKEGAIVAGQMGSSLIVLNGITAITISWVNSQIPLFSNLIAKKDYLTLDNKFKAVLKQSTLFNLFLMVILLLSIAILHKFNFALSSRFLPILPFTIIGFATSLCHIQYSFAAYLRSHKKEPLVWPSAVSGIANCLSTYFLGNKFGLMGIVLGYLFIVITSGLIWTFIIFINKRKEWHVLS